MSSLRADDPLAIQVRSVIQEGDAAALAALFAAHPDLPRATIEDTRGARRTLLHLATDWPGHFPNGGAIARALIAAGVDPDAPIASGKHAEAPLHWAASSDDVEVAEALLLGGAKIDPPGGSIGGGTPLEVAVGYGQWQVARFLATRGAAVDELWVAAALGMAARTKELLASDPPPDQDAIEHAFWQACHGGQIRTAKLLLAHGAKLDRTPWHNERTPIEVAAQADSRREALRAWLWTETGARAQALDPTARTRRLRAGEGELASRLFALMASVFGEAREPLHESYVERLLADPRFVVVAAFDSGELAGGTTAHVLPLTGKMGSALFVYDVAVRTDRQRRGLGRALMAAIEAEAAALGIDEVFVLADDEDDHAIAFYRAMGGSASPVTMFDLPVAVTLP